MEIRDIELYKPEECLADITASVSIDENLKEKIFSLLKIVKDNDLYEVAVVDYSVEFEVGDEYNEYAKIEFTKLIVSKFGFSWRGYLYDYTIETESFSYHDLEDK